MNKKISPGKVSSKLTWVITGAVIGAVVSLLFNEFVAPLFAGNPNIRFSASSDQPGMSTFEIANTGDAAATEFKITIWATALFTARTDIISIEHLGGVLEADCSVAMYQLRPMGPNRSAVASALNTVSQAVRIECVRFNPGETWHGRISYTGPEAVFGLLAHIKSSQYSENLYARFDDDNEQ